MKCNTCGRLSQNETANFCEYCGGSFREQTHTVNPPVLGQPMYTKPLMSAVIPSQEQRKNEYEGATGTSVPFNTQTGIKAEKPVAFLNWLGTYALLFIPIVGIIIFVVMLFVWAFSDTTPASKKNWARASLIFTGALILVIFVYLISVISSPIFQQMIEGTFDFNSYYKSLY